MGRSVDYLSRAANVTFLDVSSMGMQYPYNPDTEEYDEDGELEYDEFMGREDWDNLIGEIQAEFASKYPSLNTSKEWDGRETRIILENTFCEIGISEYCGLASLSIRVNDNLDNYGDNKTQLAENWIDQVWDGMLKILDTNFGHYTRLNKQGSFSNGEGVYGKATTA